jgi:hypothetical protein
MINRSRGYIVEFKRKGFVSWFLGGLLKLFNPSWDMYGWHLAILWEKSLDGWIILEAVGQGVKINYYSTKFLDRNTRCWKWFDEPPTRAKMNKFFEAHIDKKYDVQVYFWTALAVIIRHYINRPVPKLLDDRFTCWELVQYFSESIGKPIQSKYDVVLITDIIKALKKGKTNGT